MTTIATQSLPLIELTVDRYELAQAIRAAFEATVGKTEVLDIHISRFPHDYGAVVLLKHAPSPAAEAQAIVQEDRFRAAGIPLGILVRQAKTDGQEERI